MTNRDYSSMSPKEVYEDLVSREVELSRNIADPKSNPAEYVDEMSSLSKDCGANCGRVNRAGMLDNALTLQVLAEYWSNRRKRTDGRLTITKIVW